MCVTGFYRVFGRKGRGFSVRSIQRRSFDPPGLYENDVDVDDDDDDDDPNFLFFLFAIFSFSFLVFFFSFCGFPSRDATECGRISFELKEKEWKSFTDFSFPRFT